MRQWIGQFMGFRWYDPLSMSIAGYMFSLYQSRCPEVWKTCERARCGL
jgi:hypothetical protein